MSPNDSSAGRRPSGRHRVQEQPGCPYADEHMSRDQDGNLVVRWQPLSARELAVIVLVVAGWVASYAVQGRRITVLEENAVSKEYVEGRAAVNEEHYRAIVEQIGMLRGDIRTLDEKLERAREQHK